MLDSFVTPETGKPIILETENDNVPSSTVKKILYIKPDGVTKGSWTATADGNDLVYLPQTGDIDQTGTWRLQAEIEVGGKPFFGDIVEHEFKATLL